MKTIIYIFISFSVVILASSCKERGCTDLNAINYNVTADEDDGSCIVCQKTIFPYDSMELQLVDKRTSSPYYNDTVGVFFLHQFLEVPNDRVCGIENSYINMKLKNFIGENMFLDFDITEVNGPLNFYYGNDVDVQPYSTYDFNKVMSINYPPFYKITLDSLKITVNTYIIYY